MYCLSLKTTSPYFNLAVEEYLLRNTNDEYFILAINSPSVIIGKHQSSHREADTGYVTRNSIPVIRRISGGGAVYHDTGNLNFTFIRNCEPGYQVDFRKHTQPVIDFFRSSGVDVKFEGKNDLKVNGLKISGNSEHVHRNRVLHHGTLLFSSDLEKLRQSLRKDTSGYITRAVGSNPSPVSNLKDFMPSINDISGLISSMENYFLKEIPGAEKHDLRDSKIREIESLADSKYGTWEWNFAYGPEYKLVKKFDYQGNRVTCSLLVREGIIRESSVTGNKHFEELSGKLVGLKHMAEDMKEVFHGNDMNDIEVFNFF